MQQNNINLTLEIRNKNSWKICKIKKVVLNRRLSKCLKIKQLEKINKQNFVKLKFQIECKQWHKQ